MHYRKIWEKYNKACLLPGIEIHHIDGNRNNNSSDNLIPVTIQEHYNIHMQQGDILAASFIAERAVVDLDTYLDLKRQAGKKCYDNKTGFHKLTSEEKAENGRKGGHTTVKNKSGIFSESYDRRATGLKCKEEKIGFHNMSTDERRKISSLATKGKIWVINKQGNRRRILPEALEEYKINGFKEGMVYE
jgi:hypothetical protein